MRRFSDKEEWISLIKSKLREGQISPLSVQIDKEVKVGLRLDQKYHENKLKAQQILQDIKLGIPFKVQIGQEKSYISQIKNIIAVSSCKGGVGKSTIAINLAAALKQIGKRVGFFDSDIYGPSLPTLIGTENIALQSPEDDPKSVFPLDFEGLQCMSFGFLRNQKAVMRGVLAASITKELINKTIWENLDYLVIDMPPGTGDIQIQLCQDIPITGAVIVTTPQKLSYIDVVKGIEMFGDVKVPTLAIVENMSYFICNNCSQKHKIWGEAQHLDLITKQFGIKNKFQFGIDPLISQYCDSGTPYVFVLPQKACQQFYDLAETVIQEAEIVKQLKNPEIIYNESSKKIEVKYSEDKTTYIDPYELRQKCMCVDCLGKILVNTPKEVYPLQIQKKGNYAVGVFWSDGHNSSIYPYSNLEKIAK